MPVPPDRDITSASPDWTQGDSQAGTVFNPTMWGPPTLAAAPELDEQLRQITWERFRLDVPIGQGGMGRVYLAYDPVLERKVAIKFLHWQHPEAMERFMAEARAQARIEHPLVCRVYDTGEIQGHPYIAMEYVDGTSITEALREASVEQRIQVMRDVTEAVHAAHRHGLIHRDLKPGNILVVRDEEARLHPVVLDFGLACDLTLLEESLPGIAKGTPAYMAPEQAMGDTYHLDRRTDIYGLGVVLYEILTGQRPFTDFATLDKLIQLQQQGPPDLHRLPPDLAAIVAKCMQWQSSDRYGSMRELGEDLRRYLEGEPVLARTASRVERMGKWVRRNRILSLSLALVGLSLLATATTLTIGRMRAQAQANHAIAFSREVEQLEVDLATLRASAAPIPDLHVDLKRRLQRLAEEVSKSKGLARGPGYAALARAYLAVDDPEQAETYYRRALTHRYRVPEVYLGLATTLAHRMQSHVRIISTLKPALQADRFTTAESELVQFSQEHLKGIPAPDAVSLKARRLLIERRHREAEALLSKAISEAPWRQELHRLWCESLVNGHCRLLFEGHQNLEQRDFILRQLAQAQGRFPGDPYYWEKEGELRFMEARSQNDQSVLDAAPAIQRCIREAMNRWTDHPAALQLEAELEFNRAHILTGRKDDATPSLDRAEKLCHLLLSQHPDHPTAHFLLIRLAAIRIDLAPLSPEGKDHTELLERSMPHLENLRTHLPWLRGIASTEMAWAHYSHAVWQLRAGLDPTPSLTKGAELAAVGVQLHPRWSFPLNTHAALLHVQSRVENDPRPCLWTGIRDLDICLQLNPKSDGVYLNRGLRFFDLALYDIEVLAQNPGANLNEAERMFRQWGSRDPGNEQLKSMLVSTDCVRLVHGLRMGSVSNERVRDFLQQMKQLGPQQRNIFEATVLMHLAEGCLERGEDPSTELAQTRRALATTAASPVALLSISANLHLVEAEWMLSRRQDAGPNLAKAAEALERLRSSRDWTERCAAGRMAVHLALLKAQAFPHLRGSALEQARSALAAYQSAWPHTPETRLLRCEVLWHTARLNGQPPASECLQELEALSKSDLPQARRARRILHQGTSA